MGWLAPYVPLITGALSMGTSAYTSYEQQKEAKRAQKHAEQRAYARWQEASKPDPKALEAMAAQNRGQLAQARLGSYQNLTSSLASRGFGTGSGLATKEAGQIESGYLQGLGQMGTELTKYATTPMFGGPPSAAYPQPMTGATSAALGAGQSSLSNAMGYYTTMNMYNQRGQGGGVTSFQDLGPSKVQYDPITGTWQPNARPGW